MSYPVETETTENNIPTAETTAPASENGTASELTWEDLKEALESGETHEKFPFLSSDFCKSHKGFILKKVRENRELFNAYSGSDYIKKGVNKLLELLDNASDEKIKWPTLSSITEKEEKKDRSNAANAFKWLHTQSQGKKRCPDETAPLMLFASEKTSDQKQIYVTFNPFYQPAENKTKPDTQQGRQKTFLEKFSELFSNPGEEPSSDLSMKVPFSISFSQKNNSEQRRLPNSLANKKFEAEIVLKIENDIGICQLGKKIYSFKEGKKVYITTVGTGNTPPVQEENEKICFSMGNDSTDAGNKDAINNTGITIFKNLNSISLLNRYDNQYQMNNASGEVKNISAYFFPADESNKHFTLGCGKKEIQTLLEKYWVQYRNTAVSFSSLPEQEMMKEILQNSQDGFAGGFLAFCIFEAIISDFEKEKNDSAESKWIKNLPAIQSLAPPRKVDLKPFDIRKKLDEKNLRLSSSVINSAAVALNCGNHIILTGSPGTGKTTFAQRLAEEAGTSCTICTASPDWTTNELIGRYMPTVCKDEQTLEFQEGYFLQAVRKNHWLIIDELNRADIDSCMGGLFSVLSGQETILPYRVKVIVHEDQVRLADEDPVKDGAEIQYRLAGICHQKDYERLTARDDVYWYMVPDSFRIICTMNDADAGMLNQLSFALQRRFCIVRVESPEKDRIEKSIKDKIDKVWKYYSSPPVNNDKVKTLGRTMLCNKCREWLNEISTALFAPKEGFDFLSSHVIGMGQVFDIIMITIEGISCSPEFKFGKIDQEQMKGFFYSVAANAVVMKILPQLNSYIHNQEDITNVFKPALALLYDNFSGNEYLLTVDDEKNNTLRITDQKKSLRNYLYAELKMHFRNSHIDISSYWKDPDPQ